MTEAAACPRCGARIAASRISGDFAGACPRCLLGEAAQALGALVPGTRLRDFEILEAIGRGGMGTVYKARQLSLGRPVALKVLLPEHAASPGFVARFEREARLLAGLSHPNLVHVYDFGREDGTLFLAMEYVDGRQLRLPHAGLRTIVRDIALALQKVHDAGLVHRDVKPSNILIGADGIPKLGDFGIVVEPSKDGRLTETGVFVGSPHYASPEHIEGRDLDGRSDLYALGVILFEGIAGRPPFTAPSTASILAKHLHEAPPLDALDGKCGPRLRRLIGQLLSKDPAKRCARAADLAAELDLCGDERPAVSRRKLLIGAGTAVAGAALAGLAWRRPAAPATGAAKPAVPPLPVDLLRLIDPERDTIWGEWTKENGLLRVLPGRRANRLQIPYEPPEEYDVQAVVERVAGNESFHLGLSSGGRQWSLMLDTGLGGAGSSGLHFLDGKTGAENETTRIGRFLTAGVPGRVHVQVRRRAVVATIDGRPLVDWKGEFTRLSLVSSSFRMPDPKALFLGAEMDGFLVRELVLTPVSEPGQSILVPRPPPSDPKAPIDLVSLVDLRRDLIWGLWTKEAGGILRCPGGVRAHRVQIPCLLPEEYDLRVQVRRKGDDNSFHIGLSMEGRPVAMLFEAGGSRSGKSGLNMLDGRYAWQNASTIARPVLPPGVLVTLDFGVRKGRITVKADGVEVLDWKGAATQLSADPHFRIPNPRLAWIGVEVDPFDIASAVLTPITGDARLLP